jgi:hypothetical protein
MTKTATAPKPAEAAALSLSRPSPGPVFAPTDRTTLIVRAGTVFHIAGASEAFDVDTPVILPDLVAGTDYFIRLADNVLQASPVDDAGVYGVVGGFHFAPGGNALARSGGDDVPAINPFSCWDFGWRPTCADPRGMTCVDGRFWADIYLLGTEPFRDGSSKCGAEIADGASPPAKAGSGRYRNLDQPTADPDGPRLTYRFGGLWALAGSPALGTRSSSTGRTTRTSGSVRAAAVTT